MNPAAKVALVVGALGIALTASAQTPTPKSDKLLLSHLGPGCAIATVSPSRAVTVDWKCAEEFAGGDVYESNGALMAVILLAIRDGKAISK